MMPSLQTIYLPSLNADISLLLPYETVILLLVSSMQTDAYDGASI